MKYRVVKVVTRLKNGNEILFFRVEKSLLGIIWWKISVPTSLDDPSCSRTSRIERIEDAKEIIRCTKEKFKCNGKRYTISYQSLGGLQYYCPDDHSVLNSYEELERRIKRINGMQIEEVEKQVVTGI